MTKTPKSALALTLAVAAACGVAATARAQDPVPPRRRPAAPARPAPAAPQATPGDTLAVERLRIAILGFYERTPAGGMGKAVAAMLTAEYAKRDRFLLIDEADIEAARKKAEVADGALINTATALQIGKSLNADYVIFGDIQKFSVERAGKDNNKAKVTIDYRMAAVELGRLWRERTLAGDSLGDRMADPRDVTERALMHTALEFSRLPIPDPKGKVAGLDLDANRFVINMGTFNGVEKGALYQVVRAGQPVRDPDSGRTIESTREVVSYGRVEEVTEKTARLVAGEYRRSDLGQVRWRTRPEKLEAIRVGDIVEALESRKVSN